MEKINSSLPDQSDKIIKAYYSLLGDLKSLKPALEFLGDGPEFPLYGCQYYALERILKEVSKYNKMMEGIK